jgi:hypothetical protein
VFSRDLPTKLQPRPWLRWTSLTCILAQALFAAWYLVVFLDLVPA